MDILKKNFNDFTIHARIMPGLVIMFPVIVSGVIKGVIKEDALQDSIVNVLIFTIFIAILSYYSRECGRKVEEKLFKKLGGMPSTIILRHSDSFIDSRTKYRYHEILRNNIPGIKIPVDVGEELNSANSDDEYKSAVNWLRNKANSNQELYSMVYNELKNYNYTRNLYGLKKIGVAIYAVIGILEWKSIGAVNIIDLLYNPYTEYIHIIIMLLGIIIIMTISKEKNVENRAYDYAKALIEICEKIDDRNLFKGEHICQ